jgi:uncharacterized membrane protein
LQQRGKTILAASSLAMGTAIKFVPIFLAPAFVLYLFNRRGGSIRDASIFILGFLVSLSVLVAPAADRMQFILGFHSDRAGGGLSWQTIVHALAANSPSPDWSPFFLVYLGQVGSFLFPLGMLAGIMYLGQHRELSLNQLCLCMTLVYLASTKLVNEAYLLTVVVLLIVEVAAHPESRSLRRLLTFFWLVPFVWAMINVPWQGLIAYFLVETSSMTPADVKAWADIHYLDAGVLLTILAASGLACVLWYIRSVAIVAKSRME